MPAGMAGKAEGVGLGAASQARLATLRAHAAMKRERLCMFISEKTVTWHYPKYAPAISYPNLTGEKKGGPQAALLILRAA